MNRRRLLAVLATGVTGGCLGGRTHDPSADDCTATTVYSLRNGRLDIESSADADLSVTTTLIDGCTDETVLDRTRPLSLGDSVDLDEHFEPGRPYDFTLAIDDVVRFEKSILDHEGYELAIRSKSEVEITGHVVA